MLEVSPLITRMLMRAAPLICATFLLAACDSAPLGALIPANGAPEIASEGSNELAVNSTVNAPTIPPILPAVPSVPDYYVLTNRQKVIGIEPLIQGVDRDVTTYSLVQAPQYGVLLGTLPDVTYVPNTNYTGRDSFVVEGRSATLIRRKTISLQIQNSYVLPIGVPQPEFGIAQSHLNFATSTYNFGRGQEAYPTTVNGPYTHYIDFQTGNDTGNSHGTPSHPRKTIPTYLAPGSVVELHGYGFDDQLRHRIIGDGTAAKPIFVRGANAASKPVFRRPISIQGDYIIVENIEWDCQDFVNGWTGAQWIWIEEILTPSLRTFNHIGIRHCLLRDQPQTLTSDPMAIVFGVSHIPGLSPDNDTALLEHLVVYDVEVRNFGRWDDFSFVNDFGGTNFGSNTRYGWVLDSHLHHIGGDALAVTRNGGLPNQAPSRNIYLGRNYLHHCKESAVDFKLGVDCILSQNVAHTVRQSNSSLGELVSIHDDDETLTWPACDKIWILFNRLYDAEQGVLHENSGVLPPNKPSRSYIVGNMISDIRAIRGSPNVMGSAIHKGQMAQSRIVNNTIYRCDHGIWLGLSSLTDPSRCTQVVRDNIICNLTENYFNLTGQHGMHIYMTPNTIAPYTTIDHNLHWEDQGMVRFNIALPGGISTYYSTIAQLMAATGFGDGSIVSDPMFVSPLTGNFRLRSTSPAAGTGAPDFAYTWFTAQYGISMNYYLDGTPKPPARFEMGSLPVE